MHQISSRQGGVEGGGGWLRFCGIRYVQASSRSSQEYSVGPSHSMVREKEKEILTSAGCVDMSDITSVRRLEI